MSTHNICFYGELMKIILQSSPNTHHICSTGQRVPDSEERTDLASANSSLDTVSVSIELDLNGTFSPVIEK